MMTEAEVTRSVLLYFILSRRPSRCILLVLGIK
jgi:hypothetical protein